MQQVKLWCKIIREYTGRVSADYLYPYLIGLIITKPHHLRRFAEVSRHLPDFQLSGGHTSIIADPPMSITKQTRFMDFHGAFNSQKTQTTKLYNLFNYINICLYIHIIHLKFHHWVFLQSQFHSLPIFSNPRSNRAATHLRERLPRSSVMKNDLKVASHNDLKRRYPCWTYFECVSFVHEQIRLHQHAGHRLLCFIQHHCQSFKDYWMSPWGVFSSISRYVTLT